MQDDMENEMFKDLLADYAAPAADDGFSQQVLGSLETAPGHSRLKAFWVGGAAIIGAAIAGLQLPGLWRYLTGIKMPEIQTLNAPAMDTGFLTTSYGLATGAMILLLLFWVGNNVLFGEDM